MGNSTEKQINQKSAMNGRVYLPIIEVSFHTEQGLYSARTVTKNIYGEQMNPNSEVLSVTTQKQLGQTAGAWTITLAGLQWAQNVHPQDVVVIKMGYAGESYLRTVMVGLIDKCNRKKQMGTDGKPSMTSVITGRDFGKLFVKDQLKFYPEVSGKNASDYFLTDVGWINLMKVFSTDSTMKGSPARIIWNIMNYIFPKLHDVSWVLWDERGKTPAKKRVKASQLIHCTLGKTDFFMPFVFTADQYEGALWNLIQRAAPSTFTEVFIDCRDLYEFWHSSPKDRLVPHDIEIGTIGNDYFRFGQDNVKISLCLRQTPFDTGLKNNLKTHKLTQVDVIDEDLSWSDEQHYNLFWAGTSINPLGIDLKRVAPPLLNEANANKYGISPLEVNIEGLEITDQNKLESMSTSYTKKLKDWFENNHTYASGTIVIRGKADIRIGQMIDYDGAKPFMMKAYVEGVQQTFTVYQGWTTTLTVTRGISTYKPPAPPKKTTPKTYTVKKGDTIQSIAKSQYGDLTKWTRIWDVNKDMLIKRDARNATHPGKYLYVGQVLTIPAL